MLIKLAVRWVAATAPLICAFGVAANPHYREIDLSALGNVRPFAINNDGLIAFRKFENGQQFSILYDSRSGQVIRTYAAGDNISGLSADGNTTGSRASGGAWFDGGDGAVAIPLQQGLGVNDEGQVAGFAGGFFVHAAVYSTADGTTTDISLGGSQGIATAINSSGQVTGDSALPDQVTFHAFLWEAGVIRDLGSLDGPSGSSIGSAIDEKGRVAGRSSTSGNVHAFLFDGRAMVDLGTPPGCTFSQALAMNNKGSIVGDARNCPSLYGSSAFLYRHGKMLDLNDLAHAPDGAAYLRAYGINDSGSIVGFALPAAGPARPFLLVRDDGDNEQDE